ncbi:hypothetical protein CHS0354_000793 [Potamilus streckersoni]|uniref:DUF4917 family protein n=1 Tax=Potamilus streckersoni TaxID=2493646 RepID=A0AAE0T7D3_9BIVA|nr:hypothetical protein CHS0354_000793 [Potamilus streckersoni]
MKNIKQELPPYEEIQSYDKVIDHIKNANETLKNSLIDAIKKLHPEQAFAISDEKSESCVRFLNSFLSNSNNGNVFTTNYDLLLYWVLMRMLNTSDKDKICDGFGRDTEDGELSELRWGKNSGTQSIYYLHGALHLFDTGIEIVKEEYDTQHYLLQKINERMKKKEYPIFVTAGSGDDKLAHIMHNKYLSYCYDKLSAIEGSLIVYGFGFGKYDDHIIKAINKAGENRRDKDGKWHMLHSVYIGLYSKDDYKHINQIKDQFKVPIRVFKAETTNVWGEKKPY